MNARDARVLFEQHQRFLRQDRSAGAGHTHRDNLFLCVTHVFCARTISLPMALRQVKLRRQSRAMIEFAAAGEYESNRTAEDSGIRESRRTRSGQGQRAPEAFAI